MYLKRLAISIIVLILFVGSAVSQSDQPLDDALKSLISGGLSPNFEEDVEGNGLMFYGFFDVNMGGFKGRDNPWDIGPLELDMDFNYGEKFTASVAYVFDEDAAEIGVAFLDYANTENFHIQAGRFDIPFGLDYIFFATPDRETIAFPMVTDMVMDGGWNDVGLRIYGSRSVLDWTAYGLNGFDEGYAIGGKVDIFPFKNSSYAQVEGSDTDRFRVGLSYALDQDVDNEQENSFYGFDFTSTFEQLELRGEYINRENKVFDANINGFYLTGKIMPKTFKGYFVLNYGQISGDLFDSFSRITATVNFDIQEHSALKVEFLHYSDDNYLHFDEELLNDLLSAMLVVTF